MSSPFVYQSCHTNRAPYVHSRLFLYVPSSINLWVEALIIIIRLFLELFCSPADDPFQPVPWQQPAGDYEQTTALSNRVAQARTSTVDDASDQLGYLTGMRSMFGRVARIPEYGFQLCLIRGIRRRMNTVQSFVPDIGPVGTRFDQYDLYTEWRQLMTQTLAESLDSELGRRIRCISRKSRQPCIGTCLINPPAA